MIYDVNDANTMMIVKYYLGKCTYKHCQKRHISKLTKVTYEWTNHIGHCYDKIQIINNEK